MNREELTQWMRAARRVDDGSDYDGSGNRWSWVVFESGGQFFKVHFCNNAPVEAMGEAGYVRGTYEPQRVVRKVETVETVSYEDAIPIEQFHKDVRELAARLAVPAPAAVLAGALGDHEAEAIAALVICAAALAIEGKGEPYVIRGEGYVRLTGCPLNTDDGYVRLLQEGLLCEEARTIGGHLRVVIVPTPALIERLKDFLTTGLEGETDGSRRTDA